MQNVCLHVGMVKTGTTWLQKEVFPKLNTVSYYCWPDIFSDVFNGNTILISDERHCHNDYDFNIPESIDYAYTRLERLKSIFPHAKIIIGIREMGFIESLYSLFLLRGCSLPFKVFKQRVNKDFCNHHIFVSFCKDIFDDVFVYSFERLKSDPEKVVQSLCEFMGVSCLKIDYAKRWNVKIPQYQQMALRLLNRFHIYKIPGWFTFFTHYIKRIYADVG